jgi:RNA polymerase sigma-70 factor (ECF subfamily)
MPDDVQELLRRRRYDEALEQLLNGYEQKVYRMALAILRDHGRAQDVTQDVFVKLWRALPSYDGRAAVSTWLYTIARNTCLSAVRHESYRRTTDLVSVEEPRTPCVAAMDVALRESLARLPEPQRVIITLFYFEDRNVAEVAAMMGLPEGTVKSHLHRARRALGEMLE